MNKAEMNETIKAYAVANEAKKQATDEVKELGEAIRAYFEARGLEAFEADGYVAKVGIRKGKKLNLYKVAALLGGEIPADCYEDTETPVLTVHAEGRARRTRARDGGGCHGGRRVNRTGGGEGPRPSLLP